MPALSLEDLLASEDEEVKFLVYPYVPEAGVVFWFGKYGTYKTPVTFTLACAIASGQQILGLEIGGPASVLYLEADSPLQVVRGRLKQAARHVGAGEQSLLRIYPAYPGFNLLHPKTPREQKIILELQAEHRQYQFKAVFVDALRSIHSLDMANPGSPHLIYGALQELFPGAVINLIHHDRKTKHYEGASQETLDELQDESFSGSQAWVDHATVGVRVSHYEKRKNKISLKHTKSQASDLVPQLILRVIDGATVLAPNEENLHAARAALSGLSKDLPAREIDEALARELGVSDRTARTYRLRAWAFEHENAVAQSQEHLSPLDSEGVVLPPTGPNAVGSPPKGEEGASQSRDAQKGCGQPLSEAKSHTKTDPTKMGSEEG